MGREKIDFNEKAAPEEVEKMKKLNKITDIKKVPFRISKNTIILTMPENCNENFRKKWLEKL